MEKVARFQSSSSEVVRRTAPLKVMIGLLYREFDAAKTDGSVSIDRQMFESVITTLECVVEDIEARAGTKPEERRVIESAPGPTRLASAPRQ